MLTTLEKAQGTLEKAAGRIAKAADPQADSVDLSVEMVALLQARNSFKINASVVKIADEMQNSVLNLLA